MSEYRSEINSTNVRSGTYNLVYAFGILLSLVPDVSRSQKRSSWALAVGRLQVAMGVFQKIANPREIRQKLGLNQEEFWQKIGVTQSGGSRYEAGRDMPKPVTELLRLVHLEGVDLSTVRKEDIQIIEFLRSHHPDLYSKLRDAVDVEPVGVAGNTF